MFRNKNKKNNIAFAVKPSNKFFRKKTLSLALLVFIFAVSGYFGIKNYFDKKPASQSIVAAAVDDKLPGWWLQQYFGASVCTQDNCLPDVDPDKDKLTNAQEYFYHSHPLNPDTNKNGLNDGEDVAHNYDPSLPGKVSFDEISSDESILGESLVFDSDVKQLITDMTDPSTIKLPKVKPEEIIVSKNDTAAARTEYLNKLDQIVQKYFNFDVEKTLQSAMENGNTDQIDEIKIRSLKLLVELKALPTPASTAQLHKYYISLVQLIPEVISIPGPDSLGADTTADDVWYDHAQVYLVLLQKISIEKQKIKQLK